MINTAESYTVRAWKDGLEAAEVWGFCPIDTQENTPGTVGYLGAWLSNEMYGHDVAGPEDQKRTTVTEQMLHAAFTVLEDDRDAFSPDVLTSVMCTYRGETVDNFKTLAEQYAEDDYDGPDNPADSGWEGFESEHSYEVWYTANAIPEGEVCADGGDDTLYWFNRHDLRNGW